MAAADIPHDIYDHPLVKAVRQHFPGAIVTAVRPKENPVVDLSPSKFEPFAEAFDAFVSAGIIEKRRAEKAAYLAANPDATRPAIGAGRLGNECKRAISYEYWRTPVDADREIGGKQQRIFDRGHDAEKRMAGYLRDAGFKLLTENKFGKQFRFDVAAYEDGKGRIKGMLDGVLIDGPAFIGANDLFPMFYPSLWENKEVGEKKFKKLRSKGVLRAAPEHYAQCQVNMAYLDLREHPALYTAKNADSQDIYAELIAFDAAAAQAASDRGVTAISAKPEDLPRIASSAEAPACKWCDYKQRCWSAPASGSAAQPAPQWMAPPP